jgi:molybdate transport system substrate-binding protein
MADSSVSIRAHFPTNSHPPIIYPAAVIAKSEHPDAQAFLDYLQSPRADDVFTSYGFTLPAE